MLRHSFRSRRSAPVILLLAIAIVGSVESYLAEAKTSAVLLPSGDGLELQFADGTTRDKTVIPLHHVGDIRYFSTGVGLEEREADYPAYPLKIVLVVGGKPFLARVAVTIADEREAVKLVIPKEEVTGPWLYVDLPPGTYHISGVWEGQTQTNKTVRVQKGVTNTIYLRWPERRGH